MQVVGFEQPPQQPITILLYPQRCTRCNSTWNARKPRPAMCPFCKIRAYDKPRKFFKSTKERNKQYTLNRLDSDKENYRSYPFMIKDEQERQDVQRREDVIKAMSKIPDSEKRRYPCFNAFFIYPYPVYQKGAS